MKKSLFSLFLFCLFTYPFYAQQLVVTDFEQVKTPFYRPTEGTRDKHNALLELYTHEKEFRFTLKETPLKAEEGEGVIRLTLPHRTSFITITHPTYGQLSWKVPDGVLKKGHLYRAKLLIQSLGKGYKSTHQWVVFHLNPASAILYVDSTMHTTTQGVAQLYLLLGKHTVRVVSPFYDESTEEVEVTDSARLEKQISLTPLYSYLTVTTGMEGTLIRLDGQPIGTTKAETGKLMPGHYRLTVSLPPYPDYETQLEIAPAERKVVAIDPNLSRHTISQSPLLAEQKPPSLPSHTVTAESEAERDTPNPTQPHPMQATVRINAPDTTTEIWVNREFIGHGVWNGILNKGFYAVETRHDGLRSKPIYLRVENDRPLELNLPAVLSDYGVLNISSSQVGAQVYLNGTLVGTTPCLIPNLPKEETYQVRLVKEGYKVAEKRVYLHGNEQEDVVIPLRKEN